MIIQKTLIFHINEYYLLLQYNIYNSAEIWSFRMISAGIRSDVGVDDSM